MQYEYIAGLIYSQDLICMAHSICPGVIDVLCTVLCSIFSVGYIADCSHILYMYMYMYITLMYDII